MAMNTNTSILPIGISGAFRFKPKNRFVFKPGIVTINFGKPIHQAEFEKLGLEGLMTRVENDLKKLSGET